MQGAGQLSRVGIESEGPLAGAGSSSAAMALVIVDDPQRVWLTTTANASLDGAGWRAGAVH